MATLPQLADEMADQIRSTVNAATTLDVQVEPRWVLNPSPPTVDIYPGDIQRDRETAGMGDLDGAYIFTVRARIGTADFDAGYDFLIALLDDEDDLSLAQALYDDPTLGGRAQDLDVRDATGMRAYEHPSGEGAHLGCQWTVLVWAGQS